MTKDKTYIMKRPLKSRPSSPLDMARELSIKPVINKVHLIQDSSQQGGIHNQPELEQEIPKFLSRLSDYKIFEDSRKEPDFYNLYTVTGDKMPVPFLLTIMVGMVRRKSLYLQRIPKNHKFLFGLF